MTTPENGRVTRRGFARTAVGAGLVAGLGLLARPASAQQSSEADGMADTILRNGRITTLDRTRPQATALAIKDGLFAAVGEDADVMALQGRGDQGHRPRWPPRRPRSQRFPHPRHSRRVALQHGAALGRGAVARRRAAHAEGAGRAYAAAAMGARGRRLERVPVRRAALADARPRSTPRRPTRLSSSSTSTAMRS